MVPDFAGFVLEPDRLNEKQILLNWNHKGWDYEFGPHQLSDGSLRLIALATLLLQPADKLPLLIALDEPELGLHPSALEVLADIARATSQHAQILFATQSSVFVDFFDPAEVVVVNSAAGSSEFARLDARKLDAWLNDYTLGEIWEKNVIGGGPYGVKRLYLTVEGQTEAAFVISILVGHLANFNVFLAPPRFTGLNRRRRGRIPRGGLLHTFSHALADLQIWLKEDQSPEARFSMMVDLYALPNDFPGFQAGMEQSTGVAQAISLEKSLAATIGDSRFIPYLQVHEYEALVLTDPNRLATLYEIGRADLKALADQCSVYATPEDINHGSQSHPKSRIKASVPAYDENIAGPLLTENIGLPTLRDRCPHFGQWLTRLEQLDASPVG